MDEDVEMPELPPEVKINMKLDDIIKYNKIRGGVSHNLQFNRRGKWRQSDRKFRPYFKRRYPSQNWRLRGNGPNTPRFRRYQFGHQHMGRIRAFLERKWRTTPFNSVFQRLGRNPLQESAQAKVWNARNYYRPQRPHFSFLKKFNHKPIYDPNRGKKLTQSYRHYSSQLGDGLGGLSEVKVEKLNEAIGGQVTSVEEEEPEPGFVVTTIYSQRAPSSAMNSSFEDVNAMSSNSYHHARPDRNGPINGNAMSSNGYQYANPDWNGPMNGNAMSSNGHNYASPGPNGPMNGLARNPYATNPMTMNGINRSDIAISMNGGRPLYANNASNGSGNFSASFDEHSGHQNSGHFNGNGSQGNLMNGGVHAHSGLSRSVSNLNEQQLIQRLNQQRLPNDNDSVPSTSNYGRGIDQSVCIHSTNRSITSRFGGPTTTFAVIDSLKSS